MGKNSPEVVWLMVDPAIEQALGALAGRVERGGGEGMLSLEMFIRGHVLLPLPEPRHTPGFGPLLASANDCLAGLDGVIHHVGSWMVTGSHPSSPSAIWTHLRLEGLDQDPLADRASRFATLLADACRLPRFLVFVETCPLEKLDGGGRIDMADRATEAFARGRIEQDRARLDKVLDSAVSHPPEKSPRRL
jgi:hypothetical protein